MLVDGLIMPYTPCPYKDKCEIAKAGVCYHLGENHPNTFSCAAARAFELMSEKK